MKETDIEDIIYTGDDTLDMIFDEFLDGWYRYQYPSIEERSFVALSYLKRKLGVPKIKHNTDYFEIRMGELIDKKGRN